MLEMTVVMMEEMMMTGDAHPIASAVVVTAV
jgi:hypothetical protein